MLRLKERISLIGVKTEHNNQYIKLLEKHGYQVDSLEVISNPKPRRTFAREMVKLIILDLSQCVNFNYQWPCNSNRHIPVVALMDNSIKLENRENLYHKGIIDFLLPPFIAHELLNKVQMIIHYTQCVCMFKPDSANFFTTSNQSHGSSKVKQQDKLLVHETCQFLQKRLDRKLSLDDIAISMGTNRSKLAFLYKAVIGVSVFEWLREQRLLKAKELLLQTDLSIQEIGFEVGFENSANFSTAYKKYFNVNPRHQRQLK